jgi:glucose/mannose transport system substrate-binding protein
VLSCPHGSACSQGWQGAVNSAMGKFSSDQDVAGLQKALDAAAKQYATKK